ncbi:hypothetical protein AB0J83_31510 [Actinoplanes sp. NPDC049596]|uniref:hypothetical protein n=1 Tax=unclassified Actinoplanes TaxID=2626549 RepID=UPI0034339A8A
MILSQPRKVQMTGLVFPAAGIGVAALVWSSSSGIPRLAVTVLFPVIGFIACLRGWQMRVVVERGVIVVYGFFRKRMIGVGQVERLTSYPALRWRDSRGRARWTPVWIFADNPRWPMTWRRYNQAQLRRLADAAGLPRNRGVPV